ncbi:MAG TPA: hypothetical protein VGB48_02345 [Allosphingosinicella sp.]|jgi:hypothetical protein
MITTLLAILALQAEAPALPSTPADDKVTCKSEPVTGSRTKFIKTCLTAREWRERREAAAKELGESVDRGAFNNRN